MGARHIGFLAMACAVFQLSCSASAPHRGSNDASVADGTATVHRPSYTAAEANGIGWLAWAWDDNDLANCSSDDRWFRITEVCGRYSQASDVANFGKDVELDPNYGIAVLAKRASIFSK
jgi:hypothetical protein